MERQEFDVIIIGAGAAGLMGALEIALTGRKVAVIEAKDRIGGRIFTYQENNRMIELGAEFIHGRLDYTTRICKAAGATIYPVESRFWQYKDGLLKEQEDFIEDADELERKLNSVVNDKPVAAFLEEDLSEERFRDLRFSLRNYVEGYYAADVAKASTVGLREEFSKSDDTQYRIEGGYGLLVEALEKQCREKGVHFYLSQPVSQVQWKQDSVEAITEKENFLGKKILVTVPVGVLKKEGITFFPALPQIRKAVQALGFGHVIKLVMQFETPFWENAVLSDGESLSDMGFLFSSEEIPTWWTHFPNKDALLIGWLGGPRAESFQFLSQKELQKKALTSLSHFFGMDVLRLEQRLQKIYMHNWSADPYFGGSYSYEVVGGGEHIHTLQQPVEQTLFFGGEGLHPGSEIGTVEGALVSGREAAHRLIAAFSS